MRLKLKRKVTRIILTLLLVFLIIRLLPNFAPIHAKDIAQNQFAMLFSDRNGLPLGTLLTRDQENTAVVGLNQVSPYFIHAVLAAEDSNFYHHGAIDIKAIVRATTETIQAKKIVSGASTITMQLARMLKPAPRNLFSKLQEIFLSWRLTAGMSKDDILSAYINRLPMGGNIYGVEAAARTYFSIPAQDLNLAQASILAAIPNNPTYFDPYEHWERLQQRQKYVLNQMQKQGYISSSSAERTYKEKVIFTSHPQGIIAAPHFLFWLASQSTPSGKPISSPIRTTIDRPLQQFVQTQVQQVISALAANNVNDAAAVVIDNSTGEVLSYVGSPDYFNQAKLGRNDGVQALRQPGSTLKPFVYELALEKNVIHPNTILADVPSHYAIPGAKLYSPIDYSNNFLEPVRVRVALANSLNVPAVKVLEKVGVESFLERLRELGFTHLEQTPEYYGLGLTLGSGEVSLWELAKAYVTMARMGKPTELITTFADSPTTSSPMDNAPTWQLITDMLSDRHARVSAFGVDSVLNLPFTAAVKTGTSSNFRDTWTIGFTRDYTVATWVGNFNGEPMHQVSGVTGAAPLWNRIMLHLHEQEEPEAFLPPEGWEQLPICAISGFKPTSDCTSVVQEYFSSADKLTYEKPENFSLPPEYDEWLARQNQSRFAGVNLRILSPQNGDLFLVYPGKPAKQKLEFKLAQNTGKTVEWWLNGEKLVTESANSLFWTLHPGHWNLFVKSGEMTDRINFQVQLAGIKSTRRGFTVANSQS